MLTPCEEWGGVIDPDGYGRIHIDRVDGKAKAMFTHRLIWLQHHGHTDLNILHDCDNPPCINMAHLRAGTNQDNVDDKMKRGRHDNSKKTHCKRGHEFNETNTYKRKDGRRLCKTCNSPSMRKKITIERGSKWPII